MILIDRALLSKRQGSGGACNISAGPPGPGADSVGCGSVRGSARAVTASRGAKMSLNLDPAAFWAKLAAWPSVRFEVGETVLVAGVTSGRLLVLRSGAVEVVKDGTRLAEVSEPGAVFGELSLFLDRPHTAD